MVFKTVVVPLVDACMIHDTIHRSMLLMMRSTTINIVVVIHYCMERDRDGCCCGSGRCHGGV